MHVNKKNLLFFDTSPTFTGKRLFLLIIYSKSVLCYLENMTLNQFLKKIGTNVWYLEILVQSMKFFSRTLNLTKNYVKDSIIGIKTSNSRICKANVHLGFYSSSSCLILSYHTLLKKKHWNISSLLVVL